MGVLTIKPVAPFDSTAIKNLVYLSFTKHLTRLGIRLKLLSLHLYMQTIVDMIGVTNIIMSS